MFVFLTRIRACISVRATGRTGPTRGLPTPPQAGVLSSHPQTCDCRACVFAIRAAVAGGGARMRLRKLIKPKVFNEGARVGGASGAAPTSTERPLIIVFCSIPHRKAADLGFRARSRRSAETNFQQRTKRKC